MIIFTNERLYDLSEAINLALLAGDLHPQLKQVMRNCIEEITGRWQRPNGAYRTRKLLVGWNNVPMHRWGLSIAFRALSLFLWRQRKPAPGAQRENLVHS